MGRQSRRHDAVLGELVEWWEDLSGSGIGSRCVLLAVPPGWGRSTMLKRFTAAVEADEAICLLVEIAGTPPEGGLGVQARELRDALSDAAKRQRVAELLGADRPDGAVQLGLGVGGLFVPPLAAAGLLLASIGVAAAGRLWDESLAGQEGALARAARSVAAVSAAVPVVVVIDDADLLDTQLAVTLIENLIDRHDGQVLVVAAADPGSALVRALTARRWPGAPADRIQRAEAEPGMGYLERASLAAELCPGLQVAATGRIGQRTRTFAEVFAVASASVLADLEPGDESAAVQAVDAVADAQAAAVAPSSEAIVLAWAGGVLHARQASQALAAAGWQSLERDAWVVRSGPLVRLAAPVPAVLAGQVRILPSGVRRQMATGVLQAALETGADAEAGLVERVVAWQAAHRVRLDLTDLEPLEPVQLALVHGLEVLGDLTGAFQVADVALASYPAGGPSAERDELAAAVLRLAQAGAAQRRDPLIEATVNFAVAGGAAIALEARVWAAANLLGQPRRQEVALQLTDQVTEELNAGTGLGVVGDQWRLLLAFHAGRAGHPATTQRLLAPMLDPSIPQRWDAAHKILAAVDGSHADTRLQIVVLEAELQETPPGAGDDRLRLHAALGNAYAQLGDYRRAVQHGQQELPLRIHNQGAEHPDTLTIRNNLASWTGQAGDAAAARDQLAALLPLIERVLGAEHSDALTVRNNLARWTGEAGDAAAARDQLAALLPLRERVSGAEHSHTLTTRNNLAIWTGEAGDAAAARDQLAALLPLIERVLGAEHPDTLTVRNNLASWSGEAGDAAAARDQLGALLPIRERVHGAEHPHTLTTRGNLARWTGEAGDAAAARDQYAALLPICERVSGPEHPDTLTTRHNLAYWTGRAGDAAAARDQYAALLPIRERVLGAEHPHTLTTRDNLTWWTQQADGSTED